jgi:hypothetical protein
MKNISGFIPFCILFGLIAAELQAQDLNDEMKKRLRQSLTAPEKQPDRPPLKQAPIVQPFQNNEVLKVSPFTKLPTKGDRIRILHPPEESGIHINLSPTNSRPIDMRPPGSVRYEIIGGHMQIISTAGTRPGGGSITFDTGPIKKRHKKKDNILKAFQK